MTKVSKYPPEQRCKPVSEWPAADRQAWEDALTPGDLLDEGGARANHRAISNRAVTDGYGRWLTWCQCRGFLSFPGRPSDRIVPPHVREYVADLSMHNATGTILDRLDALRIMAKIMDTGSDWSWLNRIASSVRARHKPARPKFHRLVSASTLFRLGLDLMEISADRTTSFGRSVIYRDGLIIALLAARPLRQRNLTGLIIGTTVVRQGDGWWIRFQAAETKTADPIGLPWPDDLVPNLERYIAEHRPRFACPGSLATTAALWLSKRGTPLTSMGLYQLIVARTREGFGHAINPHLFRDCAATSIAIDDPVHIGIASRLLNHRSSLTIERYYNQARSIEASRLMQTHVLSLRAGERKPVGRFVGAKSKGLDFS
jgi:integrase/recombinase XerD